MPGEAVFEWVEVEVSAAAGVVWGVEPEAEIDAQDKYSEVVAHSEACVQRYLLGECIETELSAWAFFVFLQQPDVSSIDEKCSVKVGYYPEPVFGVHLELECSCLVEVGVAVDVVGAVAAGAYGAHGEGAEAAGAADIELFAP